VKWLEVKRKKAVAPPALGSSLSPTHPLRGGLSASLCRASGARAGWCGLWPISKFGSAEQGYPLLLAGPHAHELETFRNLQKCLVEWLCRDQQDLLHESRLAFTSAHSFHGNDGTMPEWKTLHAGER